MIRSVLITLFAFSILIPILGCSTTKVYYMDENKYKPTGSVDILYKEPGRSYYVIAIMEAKAPKYDNGNFVYEKMRVKAQKIGAHAIIPISHVTLPEYTSTPIRPVLHTGRKSGESELNMKGFWRAPEVWAQAYAVRYSEPD